MRQSLAATRKTWDSAQKILNRAEDSLTQVEDRERARAEREANRG